MAVYREAPFSGTSPAHSTAAAPRVAEAADSRSATGSSSRLRDAARSAVKIIRDTISTPVTSLGFRQAASFADLPAHKTIVKHRQIAATFRLADPFFRMHEDRAGATTVIDGRHFINFASYDYLGLNQHPAVGEAAKAAIDAFGTSVSASRIVAGERPFHRELELALAGLYDADDAIVFVSGHATNVSTIGMMMGESDLIIHDELVHNSAVIGAKLSRATCRTFRHNNMDHLEEVLREVRGDYKNVLIAVEGLYSMDGDFPDLNRLVQLKDAYGAWLMVDEAHSLGVLGATGRGIAEHYGVDPTRVDIWMGTLSKTLSACGGYIAGSRELIEILKFQAPGFVYSVGMSPPVAAAALKSIELMLAEPQRVAKLRANGHQFVAEARALGLNTGHGDGYAVVPIIIGDGIRAVKMTERLHARGINALPIIAPAVPMKQARLRFFITADHTPEHISTAVRVTHEELHGVGPSRAALERVAAAFSGSSV